MAKNNNLTDFLTGVADAIRAKKGTTDLINPQDFESEIASIKTEKPEQEKSISITENGTTEVTPDSGKALSKVTVTTNVQPTLQEKTVVPTTTQQIVTADSGKYGLSKVTVSAIQTEEKTQSAGTSNIEVTPTSGKYLTKVTVQPTPTETKTVTPTTAEQTITPTSGKYISKITVGAVTAEIDSNIVSENIKKDVTILGVTGTLESGASLNIEYSDTAPTDTSKLWVKSATPTNVKITPTMAASEYLNSGIGALPTAASDIACAAVGTKIYLFGGKISDTGSSLKTINVFDTTTNTITTLSATLPTAAGDIACAAVGTKIYLFGGYGGGTTALKTINVFDTTTNTITTLSTTLPTATMRATCAAVGTKIYLFGGYKFVSSSGSYLSRINVFDTTTNTITTLSATLPTAAGNIACAAVGTKIYLFGGYGGSRLNTINVFDTTTNTITTLSTTLPTATNSIACAAVGTKIYLFGGYGSSRLNTINVFNTTTNTIATLSATLPEAAFSIGCAAVGTKIYLFGGANSSYLSTINEFVVAAELSSGTIQIVQKLTDLFAIISTETLTFEIGIDKVYKGSTDNVAELCDAYLHDGTNWVNVNTGEIYSDEPTEDALAGTWVLNDVIDVTAIPSIQNINFESNSNNYNSIYNSRKMVLSYDTDNVYDDGVWTNEAYKTITITSKLSEVTNGYALLTWLQANATKQGN